jgi:hypothetical protein
VLLLELVDGADAFWAVDVDHEQPGRAPGWDGDAEAGFADEVEPGDDLVGFDCGVFVSVWGGGDFPVDGEDWPPLGGVVEGELEQLCFPRLMVGGLPRLFLTVGLL